MLPENENPELSAEQNEEQVEEIQQDSSPNSTHEQTTEEEVSSNLEPESIDTTEGDTTSPMPVVEEPLPVEANEGVPEPEENATESAVEEVVEESITVAEESTTETSDEAETPSREETTPVVEEETSPPTEEGTTPSEEEAVTATEETTPAVEEETAPPPPPREKLPPINPEILPKIDELVSNKEKRHQILNEASITDLIQLMEEYSAEKNIMAVIGRVGLLKRSYDVLKYKTPIDQALDERFRYALGEFNKLRAAFQQKADSEKHANTLRKKELLEKLKAVVDAEDPLRIKEVKEIQDEWKQIGHVKRTEIETLYREYRFSLDKFYKLREMHFELLDYDRKINLQEKERLIKEAEHIVPAEEDRENIEVWREKMDQLTELQQQWKAVGHVPREDMERINNEYRAVIDRFFDVRQGFMQIQDQLRTENGDKKKEILEKMAAFANFNAEKPRAWNDATRELRQLQDAWKEIGQAPQNINSELWSKYRELCNSFFSNKSTFFKKFDEFRAENLSKKRALVEKAEELLANKEFEKTARELKELQNTWKSIGPVPERHSNKLWNRFRTACDSFFEARRTHYTSLHENEHTNLAKKKELIQEALKLNINDFKDVQAAVGKVKEMQATWKEIGKVPFKEKDKVWEEFRGAIDAFFDTLSVKRGELRGMRMRSDVESITDDDERTRAIRGKISRIRRNVSQAQEKVDQYSINIQYISKGKSGDTLRNQIQGEIDKEVRMIADLKKQIKELNEMLKNPPKPKVEEKAPAEVEETTLETEANTSEASAEAVVEETPQAEEASPSETSATEETSTEETATEETPATEETETPAEESAETSEVAETVEVAESEAPTPEKPEAEAETAVEEEEKSAEAGTEEE